MKRMFLLIASVCAFLLLLSNSSNFSQKGKCKSQLPFMTTTLDSLQGTWINEDDSTNIITINNRMWVSVFSDGDGLISENSTIYFSDTAVSVDSFSISQIDTSIQNGKYIILYSSYDSSADCIELAVLKRNSYDFFFVIRPAMYWTASSTTLYRKL